MSLITTARALDDTRFAWRVNAAVLVTAAEKVVGADSVGKRFALYVLDTPSAKNNMMLTLAATHPNISGKVVVDQYNTVNTEGVVDEDILKVVTNNWDVVAARWETLSKPATPSPTTTNP